MEFSAFVSGLEILQPYYKNPDGCHIGAEHDQFYAYATDRPLTEDDVSRMVALGWWQPDTGEGEAYDPDDGWTCYT